MKLQSLLAALLALSATSQAATYTWTPTAAGTTYNWDDVTSNWGSGFPNAIGDIANLNINLAGAQTISLNQAITVGTINLSDSTTAFFATTIGAGTAGSLILDVASGSAAINKSTVNAVADTISAPIQLNDNLIVTNVTSNAAGAVVLSGNISESGGVKALTKAGIGPVILSGTNSYTGPTTISSGTLQIGNGGTAGSLSTSSAIINNGTLTFKRTDTITQGTHFNSVIPGVGGVTQSGTGGTLELNGANTYSGVTATTAGTLSFNSIANAGSSSAIGAYPLAGAGGISLGGGTLKYTGPTVSTDRGFTTTAASTIDVSPASGSSVLTMGACSLGAQLNVTGSSGSLNLGAVNLTAAVTMNPTTANLTVATITENGVARNLSKAGAGTLTISGASTFSGTTTVNASGGKIILGNALALQNSAYVTTNSNGSTIGVDVNGNATPTFGGLSGAVALSGAIIGYSGVTGLTLNPLTGSQTYSGIIANGSGDMTLTKTGAGTQILSGANSYTGVTTIKNGTLTLNRKTGTLSSSSGLTFSTLGGTFNMDNATTTTALTQSLGALTFDGGDGTVKETRTLGFDQLITFSSLAARTVGATGNFVLSTGTASVSNGFVLTGATANSFIDKGLFFNGVDYAWYDTSSFVRAMVYGTDSGAVTSGAGTSVASSTHQQITGAISAQEDGTAFSTFKISGANNLTLADSATVTMDSILKAGGNAATISGGTGIQPSNNSELVIRTDLAGDSLTISSNILANGANALTKTGAGTLTLSGTNTFTGGVTLNAGTLSIDNAGALGPDTGTLSINGGTLNNSSAGAITLTNNNAQTWNGNFTFTGTQGLNLGTGSVAISANSQLTVSASTLTVGGTVSGSGYTLTKKGTGTLALNGATTVGSLYANAGTISVGSSGSLSVGSGSSDTLYVGTGYAAVANTGTLDVSSASSFNVNVGNLFVGVADNAGGGAIGIGTLKLGNSSITASKSFVIGGNEPDLAGAAGNSGTVEVASGATVAIVTPTMVVGAVKNMPSGSSFTLLGTGATLNLGTTDARTVLYVSRHLGSAYSGTASAAGVKGTMDLSAGTANLYLRQLVISVDKGGNAGALPGNTGILTLGTGTNILNVLGPSGDLGGAVVVGYTDPSYDASMVNATLTAGNLSDGGAITSTDNGTAIIIAKQLGTRIPTGTLNLNGGTLTITTTGSAIAGGGGTSNLVLGNTTGNGTGMTLKAGASSSAWITNLTSAKIMATGVTFESNGYDITVDQALLTDAVSTGGGLTKAGAGTLTLTKANTYSGATTVSNGTLALGAVASLATSSVELASGATFDTSAQVTFAIPGATPVTVHLSAVDAGSAGKIKAAGLDISNANVTLLVDGDALDDSVYVLAEYGTGLLSGTDFLTVTTVPGYSIDYAYNGGTQIALVKDAAPGYDAWAQTNITDRDPGALAGPKDDPDGDGSDNLTEFGFCGDPLSGSDNPKVFCQAMNVGEGRGKELILTVAVIDDVPAEFTADPVTGSLSGASASGGITYSIQGSGDLVFPGGPDFKVVDYMGNVATTEMNAILAAENALNPDLQYVYRSFILYNSGGLPTKGFLRAVVEK